MTSHIWLYVMFGTQCFYVDVWYKVFH